MQNIKNKTKSIIVHFVIDIFMEQVIFVVPRDDNISKKIK